MSLYDTGVRPLIDNWLIEESKKLRDYGDLWSASSAGYCMRLNIMRRLGVPKVPELADDAARQQRVFTSGHLFHAWVQEITRAAGVSIAQEVELIDNELKIKGHFDDLLLIDGKLQLVDYKTAHSASFNYKKKQTEIGYYHKMQLGTYMYEIRQLQTEAVKPEWLNNYPELTEARILSISKDDLRLDEKQLLWTPELSEEVVRYWTTLNKYWAEKKLPPCTCAQHDGGFMARRSAKGKVYNDFYYEDEPCSLKWYQLWKAGKVEKQ